MKAKQVAIGGKYIAKVGGKEAVVRIDRVSPYGGWDATNIITGRSVRIRSPQRLRREPTEQELHYAQINAPAKRARSNRGPRDLRELLP